MKIIKNYLRSKTTYGRLNSLGVSTIESDLTRNLNYDDIINTFTNILRKAFSLY